MARRCWALAQGAFEARLRYAKERKQFGQPIAEFQGVQFQIAAGRDRIEAARLLVYNAARLKRRRPSPSRSSRHGQALRLPSGRAVTSQAVELFGGYGFIKDFPAEKF